MRGSPASSSAHHRRGPSGCGPNPLRSYDPRRWGSSLMRAAPSPGQLGASGVRLPPAPPRGGPLALLRFMRANGMLRPGYAALLVRLRLAEAPLRKPPADRRPVLHLPRREARDRARRDAADRALGVDRPRLQDPGARGRGEHRREDRDGPGVHDLRLPARLDRARVHPRRPRDADRLRPRRHRGRAADPPAGHLQARRRRRAQRLDRLRRLHPARRRASATTRSSARAPC